MKTLLVILFAVLAAAVGVVLSLDKGKTFSEVCRAEGGRPLIHNTMYLCLAPSSIISVPGSSLP